MDPASRPIICQAVTEEQPTFTESGGMTGYVRQTLAKKHHIQLSHGRVEHNVGKDNRVIQRTIEGVMVSFNDMGILEVDRATWERAGLTREECVAILREGQNGLRKYEVVGEDAPPAKGDARKPATSPAGAGK